MKLCITENGVKKIHKINKNEVLIGRSSDADIQLQSENISRHHISIVQDQTEFKASLLTKNNWAICMGEEMSENKTIPFFEFGEIELPGDIKIKLILEDQTSITNSSIKKIDFELSASKKKKSNPAKTKITKTAKYNKKEKSKLIPLIAISAIIIIAAWYFELI